MLEILEFGIKDIIDIFLVALLLYYAYRLMKESRSLNVFMGIIIFVIMWLIVSQILEMKLLGSIMDKLVSVGVIGLMIIFQEDSSMWVPTGACAGCGAFSPWVVTTGNILKSARRR